MVTVQPQRVALDHGAAGPHRRPTGRRGAAAGHRHRPAAPLHRRQRGQGRAAAVPDRSGAATTPRSTAHAPRWPSAEASVAVDAAERRSATRAGRDQRGQPSRRTTTPSPRCAQAEADVAAARAAVETRAHQPRLHAVAVADHRPHRQVVGHRGRAGHGRTRQTPLATVQQLDPIYVDVTQSSAELLRLQRAARAAATLKRGGDGTPVDARCSRTAATTRTRASCSSPTSRSIRAPARSRCARCSRTRSASCCPACTCARVLDEGATPAGAAGAAAGRHARRHGRRRRRWSSAPTARSSARVDHAIARSATSGWSTAGLQAGDRVIVEGLQKVAARASPVEAVPDGGSADAGTPAARAAPAASSR